MKIPGAQPKPDKTETSSTQGSLQISEIKDGIVILKDGSLRVVILGSAINFDLMSQRERGGVEMAYQAFINSLHFPIQIIIRSQRLDLDRYIDGLKQARQTQDNPLLAELMDDYIANIQGLVEEVNIMDKQFYVVVPYFPPVKTKEGLISSIQSVLQPQGVINVNETDFQQYKTELTQRAQMVAGGLGQMGIRAIPLDTQELVDLFYAAYNPDVASNQKLTDAAQLQGAAVTRAGQRVEPPGPAPSIQAPPVPPVAPPAPAITPQAPGTSPNAPSTPATDNTSGETAPIYQPNQPGPAPTQPPAAEDSQPRQTPPPASMPPAQNPPPAPPQTPPQPPAVQQPPTPPGGSQNLPPSPPGGAA